MIEKIISFSIKNKLIIFIGVLFLIVFGVNSMLKIPLDAIPDITNNQVQIVTVSPSLATEDVEKLITYQLEIAFSNIPNVKEIRSISRYGLSIITVVFEDDIPTMLARQYINEQIISVDEKIPDGLGQPTLMPITTGLGEIYQYTLEVDDDYKSKYSLIYLRDVQDWIVKRELSGTQGVIEVSSFGGYIKEYEISLYNEKLKAYNLTVTDVFNAVNRNNENSGAGYIEKNSNAYYIKIEGLANKIEEIENIRIKSIDGFPIKVKDIAKVGLGSPIRYGALTKDGEGEAVGGIALMLKGANSYQTINRIKDKVEKINKILPKGISIKPYLERSFLINETIKTVSKNLVEGGLIVIFVLVLLLGNFRGGVIVASVIPLSMLFALILMNLFGYSANLMSMGAIDFGIIIDGAVIIIENILYVIHNSGNSNFSSKKDIEKMVFESSSKIYKSAFFGVFIILTVFIPIFSLEGIEGKMFQPMAATLIFAILGSMILSITYVPMMASLFLSNKKSQKENFSDKIIRFLNKIYLNLLEFLFQFKLIVVSISALILIVAIWTFSHLGAEFLPQLDEHDLVVQLTLEPGKSLSHTIEKTTESERILLNTFPEIINVVSKIGTSEVPVDPMSIETGDIVITLKDKEKWKSANSNEELINKMSYALKKVDGASFEFSQPIRMRFNELMTGSKSDVAIQVFGDNLQKLKVIADEIKILIQKVDGVSDIKEEVTEGLKVLNFKYDKEKMSRMNVDINDVNFTLRGLLLGEKVGYTVEEDRFYDLVIRSNIKDNNNIDINTIYVRNGSGELIPISLFVKLDFIEAPMQISREQTKRRIVVGFNVRGRDTKTIVSDISSLIDNKINLPVGYTIHYGGQYENLESATNRLLLLLPIALLLIILLLYLAFKSVKISFIIITLVPFSAVGGIFALYFRNMPFSISAGVGFIALFGISVLNGIVLIDYFEENKNHFSSLKELIFKGVESRLRPVLMTAMVAALGFLPMAISTGLGAEVQKPLATVVIGGLISSTVLTLIILPILYYYFNRKLKFNANLFGAILIVFCFSQFSYSQDVLSLNNAIRIGLEKSYEIKNSKLNIDYMDEYSKTMNPFSVLNLQANIMDNKSETELQAIQSFNNVFALGKQNALNKNYKLGAELLLKLSEREVEFKIREIYIQWYYLSKKKSTLDSLIQYNQTILSKSELKYNIGEISILDITLIKANFFKIVNEKNLLVFEYNNVKSQLFSLIQIGFGDFIPESDLKIDVITQNSNINLHLLDYYSNQIEQQEIQSDIYELNNLPAIGIGYMGRKFPSGINSNGVALNIAIPFFSSNNTMLQNQAEIHKEIQTNNYLLKKLELENELKQLEIILSELQQNDYSISFDEVVSILSQSFDLGNLSIIEFYTALATIKESVLLNYENQLKADLIKNQINYITK